MKALGSFMIGVGLIILLSLVMTVDFSISYGDTQQIPLPSGRYQATDTSVDVGGSDSQ